MNPEELIAAAHAGCFSMALAYILGQAGRAPSVIETTAQVHIRPVDGIPTIERIDLNTEGEVPGLDEAAFSQFAARAKETCAVSRALAGVAHIAVSATLVGTSPGWVLRLESHEAEVERFGAVWNRTGGVGLGYPAHRVGEAWSIGQLS